MSEQVEPPPVRRVSLPLAVLLVAALAVGGLAAFGEIQSWRREPEPVPVRAARGDGRVLAGLRVDFITLGLPIERVEAVLGQGKARPERGAVVHLFDEAGVRVSAADGRVQSILVQNPNLRTPDGLGVGVDVDRVVRSFGEDYEYEGRGSEQYTLHYWSKGIHFTVKDDKVHTLLVTEPVHP